MAKVHGIFGTNMRGKVGPVVYSMSDGNQIVRQKPSEVKNPRSAAQQFQRMKMSTIQKGYASFKAICDHSFEGVTYGAKSMAKFASLNSANFPGENYYPALKDLDGATPCGFIISDGSLPSVGERVALGGVGYTQLDLGHTLADATKITTEDFRKAVGAQGGDILTVVMTYIDRENVATYGDIKQMPYVPRYARLKMPAPKGENDDPITLLEESPTGEDKTWKLSKAALELFALSNADNDEEIEDITGSYDATSIRFREIKISDDSYRWVIMIYNPSDDWKTWGEDVYLPIIGGIGYILSRKTDSGWLRSRTILPPGANKTENLQTNPWNVANVVKSYGFGTAKYLNGAVG